MRPPASLALGLASLAVLGSGAAPDPAPVAAPLGPAPGSGADCSVTIRWQTSAGELVTADSRVRVRGLPWVRIGAAWGSHGALPLFVTPYSTDAGNTLFYVNVPLNQDCDRYRRYRFRLEGRSGTRFSGISRDLYYPRENGFTRETNIDLGYLDLCMVDGHECDRPYHPGDNPTPFPPTDAPDRRSLTRPLEPASDSVPGTRPGPRVGGMSLGGEWVRFESNNHPNNGMRISIDEDGAVLTVVPSTSSRFWEEGQLLWRDIEADGVLRVRGSDGNYYPGRLTVRGEDRVDIEVQRQGRGDRQSWARAGPSLEGEWVRVAGPGEANDGLRIRVEGPEASIRYLPAEAARGLRTGGRLWREITPSGKLEMRGDDGDFHPAEAVLVDADRLRIRTTVAGIGEDQLWVRPGAVEEAREPLAGPVQDPGTPGTGLEAPTDLPSIEAPPARPPPGAVPGAACVDTSLERDQLDIEWGWGLQSPTNDDALEETLGIRELMLPASGAPPRSTDLVTDLERVKLPDMEDGFAYVWQPAGNRRLHWRQYTDLTGAELEARHQEARDGGLRPTELEAWEEAGGPRYAGVWVANTEGVGWWSGHDLTGDEYDEAARNLTRSGYRLVDVEAHQGTDGVRYAAVWYQSCDNDGWRQLRDMDRDDYQMEVEARAEDGFRVVDFESYPTIDGQRYAALWERIPGDRAWGVRSDRTLKWFLNYHRRYVDQGLRLVDFESYDTPDGVRYGGVWAENDPRHDYPYRATLDSIVDTYRTAHGLPGISVVVMQADSVLYRRGFGWADSLDQKMAHSGTVYLTASVAKAIAGTVAARLEERGEVDLSAPTADYLDGLPDHHTHTVEQLLAKMGCVPHYAEATPRTPNEQQVYAYRMDALVQMWGDTLLGNCTPGVNYRYSTHGYTYVGAVLEEVTGKPIADLLADELTLPFGLPSMSTVTTAQWGGYGGLGVRPHHLAQGYVWSPGQGASLPRDYENSTWKVLGGGLQTDAMDLARFGALTLSGAIVADTARLWTDLTAGGSSWVDSISSIQPTGLGWAVDSAGPAIPTSGRNRRIAEHGGDAPGAGSLIRLYRDGDLVIAILANQMLSSTLVNGQGRPIGHPIEGLATRIATAILPP